MVRWTVFENQVASKWPLVSRLKVESFQLFRKIARMGKKIGQGKGLIY